MLRKDIAQIQLITIRHLLLILCRLIKMLKFKKYLMKIKNQKNQATMVSSSLTIEENRTIFEKNGHKDRSPQK